MVISDKEAFRILGLPLGVDRDAIQERYKQMSGKLSSSKVPEDRKKLEQIVAAYSQLIPISQRHLISQNQNSNKGKNNRNAKSNRSAARNESFESSDEDTHSKGRPKGKTKEDMSQLADENEVSDQKKTDKKKAKRKKLKEKKKLTQNGVDAQHTSNNNRCGGEEHSHTQSEEEIVEEVQGIDPNSAFVAMVGKKINSNGVPSSSNGTSINGGSEDNKKSKNSDKNNVALLEAKQKQSWQLAMRGNEEANKGEYKRAIHLFSEAIRLNPSDHRFFGNRSFCYGQLHQYIEALKDADQAIKLAPDWPKGYFRRGRALKGLGKLLDSEESFKEVLRYHPGCEDAIQEISRLRKKRLVDMGFTDIQAKAAIRKYGQVQPALDALLSGEFQSNLEDMFFTDDDEGENDSDAEEEVNWPPPASVKPKDDKMNPRNLQGHTSLWVGNVVPDVSEKMLIKLFSKYGQVTSVRQLKEKFCAFVNYADKKSAGIAMESLQSFDLCGSKLLIRFPDNPIVNGSQNVVIRKNKN